MKSLTALILLAGIALGAIFLLAPERKPLQAAKVPRALTEAPDKGHVVRAFEVTGMCCTGCPTTLREAVNSIEGVAYVAADPGTGRVEVEVLESVSAAELTAALTFDKYTARALESLE